MMRLSHRDTGVAREQFVLVMIHTMQPLLLEPFDSTTKSNLRSSQMNLKQAPTFMFFISMHYTTATPLPLNSHLRSITKQLYFVLHFLCSCSFTPFLMR